MMPLSIAGLSFLRHARKLSGAFRVGFWNVSEVVLASACGEFTQTR